MHPTRYYQYLFFPRLERLICWRRISDKAATVPIIKMSSLFGGGSILISLAVSCPGSVETPTKGSSRALRVGCSNILRPWSHLHQFRNNRKKTSFICPVDPPTSAKAPSPKLVFLALASTPGREDSKNTAGWLGPRLEITLRFVSWISTFSSGRFH